MIEFLMRLFMASFIGPLLSWMVGWGLSPEVVILSIVASFILTYCFELLFLATESVFE